MNNLLNQYLSNLIKEESLYILNEANSMSPKDIFEKYYKDRKSQEGYTEPGTINFHDFQMITDIDPYTTPTKIGKYSKWLLDVFFSHPEGTEYIQIMDEDSDKIKEYLLTFDKAVKSGKLPVNKRDINKYKSMHDLFSTIKPFIEKKALSKDLPKYEQKLIDNHKAKIVFENAKWKIVVPDTEEAACVFGAGTEWCTTYGKYSLEPKFKSRDNAFTNYAHQSQLYIIINKQNPEEKYQFHFGGGYKFGDEQFMDAEDNPIEDLSLFFGRQGYGGLYEYFKENIDDFPDIMYRYDERMDDDRIYDE